jgi:hypothetical protein
LSEVLDWLTSTGSQDLNIRVSRCETTSFLGIIKKLESGSSLGIAFIQEGTISTDSGLTEIVCALTACKFGSEAEHHLFLAFHGASFLATLLVKGFQAFGEQLNTVLFDLEWSLAVVFKTEPNSLNWRFFLELGFWEILGTSL